MKYLLNGDKQKAKAHLWNEVDASLGSVPDTYCRMWSTGGLKQDRKWWVKADETTREICLMCKNNWGKQYAN